MLYISRELGSLGLGGTTHHSLTPALRSFKFQGYCGEEYSFYHFIYWVLNSLSRPWPPPSRLSGDLYSPLFPLAIKPRTHAHELDERQHLDLFHRRSVPHARFLHDQPSTRLALSSSTFVVVKPFNHLRNLDDESQHEYEARCYDPRSKPPSLTNSLPASTHLFGVETKPKPTYFGQYNVYHISSLPFCPRSGFSLSL